MIIQLRGTSGSGKSHIVRGILRGDALRSGHSRVRLKEAGRRQPIGYLVQWPGLAQPLAVPGHYETPCGGCDTIPDLTKVFELAAQGARRGPVLFEGLLASEDTRRTLELYREFRERLRIVHILTPVEDCLAGIQARRDARGDARPLNPTNTVNRVRTITRACDKLKEAGVEVHSTDRAGADALVREWLSHG